MLIYTDTYPYRVQIEMHKSQNNQTFAGVEYCIVMGVCVPGVSVCVAVGERCQSRRPIDNCECITITEIWQIFPLTADGAKSKRKTLPLDCINT